MKKPPLIKVSLYLTTVKGVSAGMTGAIIGTSALVGVFASFIPFGKKTPSGFCYG
ncbi:TPA: hypothetical protein QCU60_001893 [Bacillus cereus]|nr:hypothetical protein [Bacillus cereus]